MVSSWVAIFFLLLMQMTRPFFLKDIASVRILVVTFYVSCFSGQKPNINKCEIAGLGILKRAQEVVYGLQKIDLTNEREII